MPDLGCNRPPTLLAVIESKAVRVYVGYAHIHQTRAVHYRTSG